MTLLISDTHRVPPSNWTVSAPHNITTSLQNEVKKESFSTIATKHFRVSLGDGPKPLDFINRPYDTVMLDFDAPEVVYMTGRQTGKSTKLAVNLITRNVSSPGYRCLYIAPRGDQIKVFSRDVFANMCALSPTISPMIDDHNAWQMGVRAFKNASLTYFRSAFHSADPARGITAGWIAFDEFQDLISDSISILKNSARNYTDSRFFYTGTPKTYSNHLAEYYEDSCGYEWMVKCQGCNHWNFLDLSVLSPDKYICQKCGRGIDVIRDGRWVARKPSKIGEFNGFRLPTILNPNVDPKAIWRELNSPRTTVSAFCNEVMGLPYAEGDLALSEGDLRAACEERRVMAKPGESLPFPLVAGIDWGTGSQYAVTSKGEKVRSFTTIVIGGFYKGKFRIVFMARLLGADADMYNQPQVLDRIMRQFQVQGVMCDWGFGAPQNARLVNEFGWGTDKLFEVQYSRVQQNMIVWNDRSQRFVADRSAMHMRLIDDIKRNRISFPKWAEMQDFVDDFTCIYVEYNADNSTMRFDHPVGKPDDCFQATVYCKLASDVYHGVLNKFHVEPEEDMGWIPN